MILSPTDISIDVLTMLIWWLVMFRSIVSVIQNNIPVRWKAYLVLFTFVGAIYTVQTVTQFLTGATATVWLWDVLNGFVVFIALTMSSVLYESDKNNHI